MHISFLLACIIATQAQGFCSKNLFTLRKELKYHKVHLHNLVSNQVFPKDPCFRSLLSAHGDAVLADDEPLSSKFQRAVVLQRAGDHMSALKEYQTFVKAAEQCDVAPETYAEVHVNMGAIYMKLRDRKEARNSFETALKYRELGSARVNLALLALAEGQQSSNPSDGINALKEAEGHCLKALEINDDANSVRSANKLLGDIQKMLGQAGL